MHTKQLIKDEEKSERFIKTFQAYRASKIISNVGELCQNLEYAKPTLFKILDGTRMAPNNLIYKFCEYYKLDPAYFFGRSSKLLTWKESYQREIEKKKKEMIELKKDLKQVLNKY